MIKKFNIFLLLESILKADDDVISILNKIKDNSLVANELLHLINKDIKTNTNYYKLITGKNDELNFINNSQVDRLLTANEDPFLKAKNAMKIGRLARQVLDLNGSKISDVELNKFVDYWKAAIDGKDIKEENFAFVKEKDIQHWYDYNQYLGQGGTLGNSCMRDPSKSTYLNIYSNNPEVCCLLILKEKDKLIARALVWKLIKPVNGFDYYLDRIYTINDSDVNVVIDIYIDWLRKNNTIKDFKKENVLCYKTLDFRDTKIEVKLKKWKFEFYPYMDSFIFFKINNGELTNKVDEDEKSKYPMWYLQGQYGKPSSYNGWRYLKNENEFFNEDDLIKLGENNYELKSNYLLDYNGHYIKKDEAVKSDYGWIKKESLIEINGKTGPKQDTVTIGDSYKEVVEEIEDTSYGRDDYYRKGYYDYLDKSGSMRGIDKYGKGRDYYDYIMRMNNADRYYKTKRTKSVTKYEVENKRLAFKKFIELDNYVYIENTSCYIKKDSLYFYVDSNTWQNLDKLKSNESIQVYHNDNFRPNYRHRIDYGEYVGFNIKDFNITGYIKDINIEYLGFSIRDRPYTFEKNTKEDVMYCSKDYLESLFKMFPIDTIQKGNFFTDKKLEKNVIKTLKSNPDYQKSLKIYESIKDKEIIQFSMEVSMKSILDSVYRIFFGYLRYLKSYSTHDYINNWNCNPEDLILPLFILGTRLKYNLSSDIITELFYELCPYLKDKEAFYPMYRILSNEFGHYFDENKHNSLSFFYEIEEKVRNVLERDKDIFEEYFKKNYKKYADDLTIKVKENSNFKGLERKSVGSDPDVNQDFIL